MTDLSKDEFTKILVEEFNCSERTFWSQFDRSEKVFQAKLDSNEFVIKKTDSIFSDSDPLYFFLTQIRGTFLSEAGQSKIVLIAEIPIEWIFAMAFPLLIVITIIVFGGFIAVLGLPWGALMYWHFRRRARKDFEIFELSFIELLNRNTN